MCGIIDANVAHEVFGDDRPPAGERFFDWLASPRGQLVVGGDLLQELGRNRGFVRWLGTAIRSGRVRSMPNEAVNARTEELRQRDMCRSNDEHVLALALVSDARLLYTNLVSAEALSHLITHNPQPGPVGLPRSPSSWDRGHPCPQTVLAGALSRTCRGLEARAPRRAACDSAKPRGRAEDRA